MANNGQATVIAHDKPRAIPFGNHVNLKPEPVKESHSFMARLNEKAAEDITLKRGTLWFIGTALVLATVIFSYGSSAISWVRDDESQRVRLATLEVQVGQLNEKMDKLLAAQAAKDLKDAEARGYQLKAAEGDHGAKK